MQITYHGHSCVQLSDGRHSLIIDPFLTGNPVAVTRAEDIAVQHVLLTHGHSDHIADAVGIAKRNDAEVIAIFELASYMESQGVKATGMNIGGSVAKEFGRVKMVQAFHSSSVMTDDGRIVYMGMPAGLIIHFAGHTILHCGDTSLFGDMKLIGERHEIDLAFIPIGDLFTMGPDDAALAAQWLKAKFVVPIHYNTFPTIQQDGDQFVRSLEPYGIQGKAMKPGESINFA